VETMSQYISSYEEAMCLAHEEYPRTTIILTIFYCLTRPKTNGKNTSLLDMENNS